MTAAGPHTPDRRPLAARHWRISRRLATLLVRLGISPNLISTLGMVCGVGAGVSLAATTFVPEFERVFWLLAVLLIALRGLANMLDGMVALESGMASPVGELFNEVPDRISDAAMLIGSGYAVGGEPILGYWAALAAVFTAYVRAMGKVAGAAQDYCGPMAKMQRMAVLVIVALYGGLAPQSWQPAWGDPARWGLPTLALCVILLGCIVTAIRRLLRIAARLRKPT